jgi:hypothetical protein
MEPNTNIVRNPHLLHLPLSETTACSAVSSAEVTGRDHGRPWHRYSRTVGRGRSCFSCGETQSGSGQFCRTCGKPLDAPDLELLSGEVNTNSGTDVVMSVGGSKGRSAVAIVAVLAALGGVAAFSGKSAKSTTATSTTIQRPLRATTTTTAPFEISTTSTTDDAVVRAGEIELIQPRTVTTPILPEKTGLKLLVVGMPVGGGQSRTAIIDLDSGLVTPYTGFGIEQAQSIQPFGAGLVVSGNDVARRFEIWQPNGTKQTVQVPPDSSAGFRQNELLAGDIMWSVVGSPNQTEITLFKLVGNDVRDGHQVGEISLPETARLLGLDDQNRPVVVDLGSGTYVLDPATVTFKRITTNLTSAAQGDVRIENVCDEQLRCGTVRLKGGQAPQPLPESNFFRNQISLSPNGEIALRATYGNGGAADVEAIDLTTGAVQKVDVQADSYPPTLAWSTDSKWLFGVANGEVKAWKVGTPETLTLSLDGDTLRATAVGVFPTG